MKVEEVFETSIGIGVLHDPRGEQEVENCLADRRTAYEGLKWIRKELADPNHLKHPYDDSRILNLGHQDDVGQMMVGIDIGSEQLNTARILGIKTCWSHHPHGAETGVHLVMEIQRAIFHRAGISFGVIDKLMAKRKKEVERRFLPINMEGPISTARQLGITLFATHTPADNCVQAFLQELLDKAKPRTLGNLQDYLLQFPEFRHAYQIGQGCKLVNGEESNRAGKILVQMTGGTQGPVDIYPPLAQAGIDTIVGMHFSDEHVKAAEEAGVNLMIAGHMASDTMGMNRLIDMAEEQLGERFQIATGFQRIKRRTTGDIAGEEVSN